MLTTINRQRGFTLIELIMVIVIMGVIGGMVSVFMKSPIDAYIASGRRAAMTDVADTVVRRMARDIRKALPNSIRPLGSSQCIEFIPTKTGGRYRAEVDGSSGAGDVLDFTTADTGFDVFGDTGTTAIPPDQRVAANDLVAVYNLGIPGSDAYSQSNLALVKSSTPGIVTSSVSITGDLANISSTTGMQFPLASGGNRFHVIPSGEQVVSYICTGVGTTAGEGTGTLYRFARTLVSTSAAFSTCPVPVAGSAGISVLAQNLSTCNFVYDALTQRNALVQMTIGITRSDETVRLYHEIHVDNTP